jgi:hypothetical protein
MKRAFFILITVIPIFVSGQQETIKRTVKNYDSKSIEKFYVLKTDENIRHGEYKRFWGSKLAVKGMYNNDNKGLFEYYFYDKKPSLIYDYSTNEVVSYSKDDCFKGVYSSLGKKIEVDRPPLPLFSRYELGWYIASNVKYPYEAKENGLSGKIEILVTIGKNGNIENYSLFFGVHKILIKESLRVLNTIPKEWKFVPAVKDGKPIKSAIVLPVNFQLN